MPFRIDTQCSDKEAICEDTCLFDAIKEVNPASDKTRRTLQIDPELCTDCGACALACPEAAIHYAQGVTLSAQHYSSSVSMASVPASLEGDTPAGTHGSDMEIPEGLVLLNGKPESWAKLMAACCD